MICLFSFLLKQKMCTYSSADSYDEQILCNDNNLWGRGIIRKEKNILNDLVDKKFSSIPNEVKEKANSIYMSMKGQTSRKGNNRILLIYYCVYCAYMELDIEFSPFNLSDLFNLNKQQTSKCSSMFSKVYTGYAPPKDKKIEVWYYFSDFCKKGGLTDEAAEEMKDLFFEILDKCTNNNLCETPLLLESKPHSVSAALFKYYLTIHGIKIDVDKFNDITTLSCATIKPIYDIISEIHNM